MPTPCGADQFFPRKHPRWKGLPGSQPQGLALSLLNEAKVAEQSVKKLRSAEYHPNARGGRFINEGVLHRRQLPDHPNLLCVGDGAVLNSPAARA